MNELIRIDYTNDQPAVSARELHEFLGVDTPYHKWFPRMCEYGFTEGQDYAVTDIFVHHSQGGSQSKKDAAVSIDMAKEICMLQRNEKGKIARQYFIQLEKDWNSPEKVMARALRIAERKIKSLESANATLNEQVSVQQQQIAEMRPKANYYDVVLNCKDLVSISTIAKDYGWSATRMNKYLNKKGVQYKQGDIWLLYQKHAEQGYTSTKTHSYPGNDGEVHSKTHTYWTQKGRLFIYALLKSDGMLPLIEMGGAA